MGNNNVREELMKNHTNVWWRNIHDGNDGGSDNDGYNRGNDGDDDDGGGYDGHDDGHDDDGHDGHDGGNDGDAWW